MTTDLHRHPVSRCEWHDHPGTAQTVNYGSSLTFTATPNTGYTVNTWSVDGTVQQTGGTTFTLSNITANHTVQVTFSC